MKHLVKQAFLAIRQGYSPDRVVADPALNCEFITACRSRGLRQSALELNVCLLNLRRASDLPGLKSKRTRFPDQDEYLFASEIAARFMERKHGVSLDHVVCDPALAAEFDQIAAEIAPGYTPLRYRWGAFSLRKTRRLRPEPVGHAVRAIGAWRGRADGLLLKDVPTQQGVYVITDSNQVLYVGEATNLRKRIQKHLKHSDNAQLARFLWQTPLDGLFVEYYLLPDQTGTRQRRAYEQELIRTRKSEFNIAGTQLGSGKK